jgi:hypothetical protein
MVADMLERWCSRGWLYTHFPSGELRSKATAGRLKRMGMKAGWPDFLLLSPDVRLHCLELKRRGGTLNDAQQNFCDWCAEHGAAYRIAFSFDEAMACLKNWGALRVRISA